MKKRLLFTGFVLLSLAVSAQIDVGTPIATGKGGAATAIIRNWDAIGINPANLGWNDNYKLSIGAFNFGITAQSEAFKSKTLRTALLNPNDTFSTADKQFYAKTFDSPNALNLQANLTWGAFSLYFPKVGGFACSLRDRTFAHVGLNQNAADFIFNGQNAAMFQDTATYSKTLGQLFDSTNISFLHYREFNLAYGRRIFSSGPEDEDGNPAIQLYAGVGFKFIWGFSSINTKAENGVMSGNGSLSTDYSIDYSSINNFTPQTPSTIFHANGSGMAFDGGLSMIVHDRWRFAAAVNDLGSISWKNNQLFSTDTTMTPPDTTNNGINSWNMASGGSFAFADNGLFNYGPGPDFKTTLPGRIRFGAGMKLKKFEAAIDMAIPIGNKDLNLSQPYFAVGGEYNILGWVKISAGFSGNPDMGWSVPFGIVAGVGGVVEIGVATGDILTFIDQSKNPYLSMSFFALRFNMKPFKKDTPMPTQ